ncbi:hypothetical protein C0991_007763, partial [Blastosporella zonata]
TLSWGSVDGDGSKISTGARSASIYSEPGTAPRPRFLRPSEFPTHFQLPPLLDGISINDGGHPFHWMGLLSSPNKIYGPTDRAVHGMPHVTGAAPPVAARKVSMGAATANDPVYVSQDQQEEKETAAGNVEEDTGRAAQLRLPDNLEDMCIVSEDNEDDGTTTAGLPLPTDVDEMYTLSEDEQDLGRTAAGLRLPGNLDKIYTPSEDDERKETAAGNVADDTGTAAQLRLLDNLEDMCIVSEDDEDGGTMAAGLPLPTNVDEMYNLGRTAADL